MTTRRQFLAGTAAAGVAALLPAQQQFPHGWRVIEGSAAEPMYGEIGRSYTKQLAASIMKTKEYIAAELYAAGFSTENL